MKALDLVIRISAYAPQIRLESKMLKPLKKLRPDASEAKYTGAAIVLSLGAGVLIGALALAMGESAAFGLIGSALAFGFVLMLPSLEMRARTAEFEARLPLMLRTLSMLLDMRIPFQKALELTSADEPEMRPVLDDIGNGVTVQKAFARLAITHDSFTVKRALSQLLTAYEVGSSGHEIARIGDEMLSMQRHALREHASRSAIFGLMFIVSAAVLPTFFLVYAILGGFSADASASVDQGGMAIAMLVIFPLISLMILLLARAMLPRSALESGSGGMDITVFGPCALMVASFVFLPQGFALPGGGLGAMAAGYLVWSKYNDEKRTEDLERHLPDALFAVAGLPKSTRMEDLFGVIERSGYGPLSEEAGKCRKQLAANLSTGTVLEDLSSRNRSPMLGRACEMLAHVFSTNSFDRLNRLAEDMMEFAEVKRERAGLLSMQKYTLVFGGLLIPLILRITLDLLGSMAGLFSDGGATPQIGFAYSLAPAYLIIYALLASIYISAIDERRSRSAGYFLAIAALALSAFFLINI